jgi:hypothetical protein
MQTRGGSALPPGAEPRRRRSRAGLVLGYFVIGLLLVAACIAIYVYHSRAEAVEGHRELSSIAQLVSNELADWLAERREDAAYFSDPIIAGPLAEVASDRAGETTLERLRASLERLRARHGAAALFFVDAHGAVRLSFPDQGAEPSSATLALADSALRSGRAEVSELGSHERGLGHAIEFAGPVAAQEGGDPDGAAPVAGVIVVRYEVEKVFGPMLAAWSHHSGTGRALLVWKEAGGWAALDGRSGKIETASSTDAPGELARLARGFERPAATVWHEGSGAGEKVAQWQEVQGTPWRVIVEMRAREAEAGSGMAGFYLSLALALALALGGFLALKLWSTRADLAVERQRIADRPAST